MSLVHEALRKAEREKQRKTGVVPPAPVAPTPAAAPAPTPVIHQPVQPKPAARAPEPRQENHFLLPALIGCVAIVAIIAIVFLVSNATANRQQSKQDLPPPVLTPKAVSVKKAPVVTSESVEPVVSIPALNIPEPPAPSEESKYQLSGIMKDPDGKPVAVLNGRVVYEGHFVEGATVEKIETDRITISVNNRKIVLRMF